ncbi:MAG: hypothetical protein HY318_07860 [Armatimonadetes bacterium]|nr:hypothetical protein [Armatimonadota bacterium]
MPDRISKDLVRGVVSVGVLGKIGPVADYSPERQTALQQMIAKVRGKQAVSNSTESAKSIKRADNRKLYRELWVKLINFYAVALVTAPESAQAALKNIDTSLDFSDDNCLVRAQQTLGALTHIPEDYSASGMTKAALEAAITAAFADDAEEQSLISADAIADGELKVADQELHAELVDLLKILQANIPDGDPRREAVDNIPRAAAAAAATATTPTTPTTPSLPTDLPGGTSG